MVDFTLNAQARSDLGKGASRRLRRNANLVPAVIYGGDKAPQSISVELREISKLLENEAAFSHTISLSVDGQVESVLIKALQRHPSKNFVVHADFQRAIAGQKVTVLVPLHFVNEAASVGVKAGGEVSHLSTEVEVSVQPQDLPEFIEVDLSALEVGQIIHLSDLKLPAGVELVALAHGNDAAVASIHAPRVDSSEEAAE